MKIFDAFAVLNISNIFNIRNISCMILWFFVRIHEFANTCQTEVPVIDNACEHVHFCHANSITFLILLNKEGAFMNAKPALNHFIKARSFAGRSINFYDDMIVFAHDCIATNVDRKHSGE
jgi:hypothetical protein